MQVVNQHKPNSTAADLVGSLNIFMNHTGASHETKPFIREIYRIWRTIARFRSWCGSTEPTSTRGGDRFRKLQHSPDH